MTYLLDTHVWVWWNMAPARLSRRVHQVLASPGRDDSFLLSAISPWEFCMLLAKGRLAITGDALDWVEAALDMPLLRLVDITPRISSRVATLPAPFHDDPADQIIVATARAEAATVLTKDRRILDYPHVKSLW